MNLERTHDVLVKVAEFLRKLPEDQVEALLNGDARLELIPKGSKVTGPAAPKAAAVLPVTAERVDADLKAFTDRAAALKYLKDLKLTKPLLLELAKQINVPAVSKETATTIYANIVQQKVGMRLTADTIMARR